MYGFKNASNGRNGYFPYICSIFWVCGNRDAVTRNSDISTSKKIKIGTVMTSRNIFGALKIILLTGCTTPAVDHEAAGFDAARFSNDLDDCRGGSVYSFTLKTVGGTLIGSAIGAVNGVFYGGLAGDGAEGAVVGAVVGGGLGFGVGAMKFLSDQGNSIEPCLQNKGYVILPV